MSQMQFRPHLEAAIAASDAPSLPYAKALLENCGSGSSSDVLETMEWLADHCYMAPSEACREVLDKAFTACDYRHGTVYPATLSHVDSDQLIDGWARYHAGRPYGMPIYLTPETAARLPHDAATTGHVVMEVATAHGIQRLIPVPEFGWDVITIELPHHPSDPISPPGLDDIPF